MISKKILIASLTGAAFIIAVIFFASRKPVEAPTNCPDFREGQITVGEKVLHVALAQTHEEKIHGLSGCEGLPESSGMLFTYESPEKVVYWMKDMLIPLDIIWIKDGKVVGLEENVPAPAPNTPVKDLVQYQSPGPVDSVLEIKSGGAQEYGIDKGDSVF